MADFSMYGPEQGGARLAQFDQQKMQLNNLAIQEGQQTLQLNEGKLLDQAQARQQQEQAKAQQAQALDILQRDQAKTLPEIGMDMIKSGLIKQGSDVLAVAANVNEKLAMTDKYKAETEIKQTEAKLQQIDRFSAAVAGTNSQEEWDAAVKKAEQIYGKEAPPAIKNATWSPETKEKLANLGATWKERQTVELQKQKLAAENAGRESQDRLRKAQIAKEQAQTKEIEKRTENISKAEGKAAAMPNKALLGAATNMIKADHPGMSEVEIANTSSYVTSQAQNALKNNKALDWDTALNQEYSKIKADIKPVTVPGTGWFGRDKETEKFVRPTTTKAAMPTASAKAPATGTVQQGYKFKGGNPADKSNWEKI